ncbi:hypothetical protein P7K49_027279 [Saguinus oedipus]|uniref:Uncharacterized protein n=1 Tax=Saguinus oedipus TaxID=9490 RepID=A0ABQ9U955_SAGOE|nr:hypothetical protein P7K49_027279 [Saguinus oedipus]
MKASGTLREYKVVGRCLPTPTCHTPPLYRTRIFVLNHIVSKFRFWHLVSQLKKMKKSSGETKKPKQLEAIKQLQEDAVNQEANLRKRLQEASQRLEDAEEQVKDRD